MAANATQNKYAKRIMYSFLATLLMCDKEVVEV